MSLTRKFAEWGLPAATMAAVLFLAPQFADAQTKGNTSNPTSGTTIAKVVRPATKAPATTNDNEKKEKPASSLAQDYAKENNSVGIAITVGRDSELFKTEGAAAEEKLKILVGKKLAEQGLPYKIFIEFDETPGVSADVYLKGDPYIDEASGDGLLSLRKLAISFPEIKRKFDKTPDRPVKQVAVLQPSPEQ